MAQNWAIFEVPPKMGYFWGSKNSTTETGGSKNSRSIGQKWPQKWRFLGVFGAVSREGGGAPPWTLPGGRFRRLRRTSEECAPRRRAVDCFVNAGSSSTTGRGGNGLRPFARYTMLSRIQGGGHPSLDPPPSGGGLPRPSAWNADFCILSQFGDGGILGHVRDLSCFCRFCTSGGKRSKMTHFWAIFGPKMGHFWGSIFRPEAEKWLPRAGFTGSRENKVSFPCLKNFVFLTFSALKGPKKTSF